MTKTKRVVILTLVCLNMALLGLLVFLNTPAASAQQTEFRSTDYLVVTGRVGEDLDALYVLDLAQQKLAVIKYDKTNRQLAPLATRTLPSDFGGGR